MSTPITIYVPHVFGGTFPITYTPAAPPPPRTSNISANALDMGTHAVTNSIALASTFKAEAKPSDLPAFKPSKKRKED